jgi:hypothetical protein
MIFQYYRRMQRIIRIRDVWQIRLFNDVYFNQRL